ILSVVPADVVAATSSHDSAPPPQRTGSADVAPRIPCKSLSKGGKLVPQRLRCLDGDRPIERRQDPRNPVEPLGPESHAVDIVAAEALERREPGRQPAPNPFLARLNDDRHLVRPWCRGERGENVLRRL